METNQTAKLSPAFVEFVKHLDPAVRVLATAKRVESIQEAFRGGLAQFDRRSE